MQGGVGIDAGIKGPISGFSPSATAYTACMAALNLACQSAKAVNCVAKQITKKDVCEKEVCDRCLC